jgi:hypothetical protein
MRQAFRLHAAFSNCSGMRQAFRLHAAFSKALTASANVSIGPTNDRRRITVYLLVRFSGRLSKHQLECFKMRQYPSLEVGYRFFNALLATKFPISAPSAIP